jgi:hypothetical protein
MRTHRRSDRARVGPSFTGTTAWFAAAGRRLFRAEARSGRPVRVSAVWGSLRTGWLTPTGPEYELTYRISGLQT